MNGTKNGTIVLNEKTERAVKAAFGAQNFIVNHKMRGESASESIFYNHSRNTLHKNFPVFSQKFPFFFYKYVKCGFNAPEVRV